MVNFEKSSNVETAPISQPVSDHFNPKSHTSLPGQFADIHSPDKLSDHDIVSGTLKIAIPPIKKPRRKVYRYQKGDYESMRAETLYKITRS